MKKIILFLIFFSFAILTEGCLVFNTVSYVINIDDSGKGIVNVYVQDIKSNADSTAEFEKDKENLFDYLLKSDEFVDKMKGEGKFITSRKLILNNGNLDANITYTFENINDVENIRKDKDFYYLTLNMQDSVVSTNGQVITTAEHKRILWESSSKTLKFQMFSNAMTDTSFKSLAEYYKEDE